MLIVLGDHYFFTDSIATGRMGPSRDTHINSDEDLDAYLKTHPESLGKIRKSNTTYINRQAPIGLFRLMSMFGGGVAQVEMKYSSQLKWEDTPEQTPHLYRIGKNTAVSETNTRTRWFKVRSGTRLVQLSNSRQHPFFR